MCMLICSMNHEHTEDEPFVFGKHVRNLPCTKLSVVLCPVPSGRKFDTVSPSFLCRPSSTFSLLQNLKAKEPFELQGGQGYPRLQESCMKQKESLQNQAHGIENSKCRSLLSESVLFLQMQGDQDTVCCNRLWIF